MKTCGAIEDTVVAILAGGQGSRLRLRDDEPPKPMIAVGGYPIIVHIINYFARAGFRKFVIAVGYKASFLHTYFDKYNNRLEIPVTAGSDGGVTKYLENISIELVDTGDDVDNGGRIKRLTPYLENKTFVLAWCDGLMDVDLTALMQFHKGHDGLATVTAVHPPSQFGQVVFNSDDGLVSSFAEKPFLNDNWINGGLFVLEPEVLDLIEGDATHWETGPMLELTDRDELFAFRHDGFWMNMDTWREQKVLEDMWNKGHAPWIA